MRSHEFLTGLQAPWLFEDLSPQALETLLSHRNRWVEGYMSDVVKAASRRYMRTEPRLAYFEQCIVGLVSNYMLHVMRQNMVGYLIDLDQPAKFMCEQANDRKEVVYLGSPLAGCVGDDEVVRSQGFVGTPNLFSTKGQATGDAPIGLIVARYSPSVRDRLDVFGDRTVSRWSNEVEICLFGDESPRAWSLPSRALAERLDYVEASFRLGARTLHVGMYS